MDQNIERIIKKCLIYDFEQRITIEDLVKDEWLSEKEI